MTYRVTRRFRADANSPPELSGFPRHAAPAHCERTATECQGPRQSQKEPRICPLKSSRTPQ